jgi:hypothetical protein
MNKIYYSLSDYLKQKYKEKVYKITVDGGFSCPNRDGTKGFGGCIYCNNEAFVNVNGDNIKEQVYKSIGRLNKKGIKKYIIYFQAYSNTYGNLEEIRRKIEASLIDENIVGLYIGTRPDVIDEEKLEYFSSLNKEYDVFLEYGLQSKHEKTLEFINRGHTLKDFENAYLLTKEMGLKVCVHVIFGLPCETKEMMLETVNYLAKLGIDAIKFHHLQIVKNTKLADIYKKKLFRLFSENDYITMIAKALSLLSPDTIISRLVGSSKNYLLIAPDWPSSTTEFLNKLKDFMINNNIYQGKFYNASLF